RCDSLGRGSQRKPADGSYRGYIWDLARESPCLPLQLLAQVDKLLSPKCFGCVRVEGDGAVQDALEHGEGMAAHVHVSPVQGLQERRHGCRSVLHQLQGGRGVLFRLEAFDEAM